MQNQDGKWVFSIERDQFEWVQVQIDGDWVFNEQEDVYIWTKKEKENVGTN